jgi:selenide, water dikinase
LGPRDLDRALGSLPRQNLPEILVGYENADDAGVYALTGDVALVQTVDFFSPIVDDPFLFGQIAAANSLSDVYAMGGTPKTALSIVGFPEKLDFAILGEIIKGGLAKLNEAGVALLGGHTVRDDEIKFGYAVTGVVDRKNIKQNIGARIGNRIFLTKPLGTGLISTALKKGQAKEEHVRSAVEVMVELNKRAAETALRFAVDTMTDITGFGLIGHAREVARASQVAISIDHRQLPLLPGALEYSRAGFCAGGLKSNREFYSGLIRIADSVPADYQDVLFDPQTSGGLLIFCRPEDVDRLREGFASEHLPLHEIGLVNAGNPGWIEVT